MPSEKTTKNNDFSLIPVKVSILEEVRHSEPCKHELKKYFNYISDNTLNRWLSNPKDGRRFTEIKALEIIASFLGYSTIYELLEN